MKAVLLTMTIVTILLLPGCGDFGRDLPNTPPPVVRSIAPDSGKAGDTVTIAGSGFGSSSSGTVRFASIAAQRTLSWSDTAIGVVVPPGVPLGIVSVIVSVGSSSSNSVSFKVITVVVIVRSFANDILPRFTHYGCAGCHGGNGGLFVDTQPHLLQGGDHGPAVIPGNADSSLIIKKLSPTPPFGSRMPLGGPYLADTTIQVLKDWINQGALNN